MAKNVPKSRQLGAKLGPSWRLKIILATARGHKKGPKTGVGKQCQEDVGKKSKTRPPATRGTRGSTLGKGVGGRDRSLRSSKSLVFKPKPPEPRGLVGFALARTYGYAHTHAQEHACAHRLSSAHVQADQRPHPRRHIHAKARAHRRAHAHKHLHAQPHTQ